MNQLIKKATEDYPALNIPTHILWGAVEAELMGGKASTGAISTAAGELGAKYLTEHLYNKEAKDLTETERSQVKEMAKALASVAGGLAAAGQGASAVKILSESLIGTTVANNAVENNYLYNGEVNSLVKELAKAEKEGKDTRPIFEKYAKLSEKNRQEILKSCGNNPACYIPHIQMMQSGDEAAYENFSYLRLGTYFNNLSRETQVKLSDFVESENSKTRNQLPKSVHYATFALGAAEAAGLGGLALKTKLPKGANANEVLPVVGKSKGYENQTTRISTGAENNALYPKLKEQLIQENFKNIASQDPKLQAVYDGLLGKGINYGVKGTISSAESDRLGRLWVGEGYSEVKYKGEIIGYNSQDRLRGYRKPSEKSTSYAETGVQSNFETYRIVPGTDEKQKIGNAHFNIKD